MFSDKLPSIDDWILPGQNVLKSMPIEYSADQVFKESVGLENSYKKQFTTFGNPDRIKSKKDELWLKSKGSEARIISIAYYFLLPKNRLDESIFNTASNGWFHIDNLPELGFDHREIIEKAFQELKNKAFSQPLIFELLPSKFTLNELQFAYESLYGLTIDNRNFRKKVINKPYIISLEEKRIMENAKKPAKVFMFSMDVYNQTKNKKSVILPQ